MKQNLFYRWGVHFEVRFKYVKSLTVLVMLSCSFNSFKPARSKTQEYPEWPKMDESTKFSDCNNKYFDHFLISQ